jgi:predicted nicotinamide N-methyase
MNPIHSLHAFCLSFLFFFFFQEIVGGGGAAANHSQKQCTCYCLINITLTHNIMKDNREKVGDATDHKLAGHLVNLVPKAKRLVLPFGPPETRRCDVRETHHEHYIREIPLAGGGLGCALWDGGLVLARWVYQNGGVVFHNKSVLELGCGVGLAGIIAAHWASHVTLTDYIEETVRNAIYNAKLNSADEESDSDDDEGEVDEMVEAKPLCRLEVVHGAPYRRAVADRISARMLDWDAELAAAAADTAASPEQADAKEASQRCCSGVKDHLGHRAFPVHQAWFRCSTCWPTDPSKGVCCACASRCHAAHALSEQPAERFLCDCSSSDVLVAAKGDNAGGSVCSAMPPQPPISPVDVIIGSELTYSLLSCSSLAHVADTYLAKPHGVFYEVLSDDRDGVAVFIDEMDKRGFDTIKRAAPAAYVGKFGTRKWSKQDQESYSFYTWRRRDCPEKLLAPIME